MSNLYMCVLRNSEGGCKEPTPSEMDEAFAKFQQWQEKFADNIEDMGGKLGDGKILTEKGVVDGPFMEIKEIVGGYMVVRAESLDEAVQVVRECPPVAASLKSSTSVEIRELCKM
ncbi:YciI family protein [Porticoccus sp. W117]|uniref:YciI family protein n=1 Tax=Porticoccus sp. W117 TaxID=3054777 RepID=UPI002593D765|nr:YciI family protein [Porticoccus sp. W117]MDM3872011.1 YciI family protein [Porticoccus sp. W117]